KLLEKTLIVIRVCRSRAAPEGLPVSCRRRHQNDVGSDGLVTNIRAAVTPGEHHDRRGLTTRRLHNALQGGGTETPAAGPILRQSEAIRSTMRGGVHDAPLPWLDVHQRDGIAQLRHRGQAYTV